jgi:NAD-dependent deacetylase
MRHSAADRIVILTGAGVSRESGLHTFRDADGIWSRVRIEDVATPEAFRRDPARVQAFYNVRRKELLSGAIRPNAAHEALARLERDHPGEVLLVTQNIDDLHERAGSRNVIHMHGELLKSRCGATGEVHDQPGDISPQERCACCGAAGSLRPHVVWFGEVPFGLDRIYAALRSCGLFFTVGTSGQVWPAAGFVEEVRLRSRARTVELNLELTGLSPVFDESLIGPATEIVPPFVERLLEQSA